MNTLSKACRNTNGRLGFAPNHSISVPFSTAAFKQTFQQFISRVSAPENDVKCTISVDDLNTAVGTECDKYIKPTSSIQERIFGPIKIHFFQKKVEIADNEKCER